VSQLSELSWNVEKEDGEDYYINFSIFKNKFVCSCFWNINTQKECRHIRMIKEYITSGITQFEE
jgi:hypothetical protein